MMKFVHHARDEFYPNVAVDEAARWLLQSYFKIEIPDKANSKELLMYLRNEDKK